MRDGVRRGRELLPGRVYQAFHGRRCCWDGWDRADSCQPAPTLGGMGDVRRWGTPVAVVAAALGAGVGAVLVLGLVVRAITRGRIVTAGTLPHLPVVLVLGAEVYADGVPSTFLRARLDVALDLYRRGLVERILLSGDGRSRFYDETGGMRAYLLGRGVEDSVLLVDPAGLDTYDSCLRARDVYDIERLVVVSQTYHLPRALAICRALGLDAWGVGDDSARSSARPWANGTRRELAANLKLVWDLLSHRPPRSGTHRL